MRISKFVVAAMVALSFGTAARADDWPSRNLRILVPFPAGGSSDTQARATEPNDKATMAATTNFEIRITAKSPGKTRWRSG